MAYQALYRKYRPTRFEEVVGQKPIIQTLQNAVKTNRIAHAYLFSGPRGTGKTSIAKIFARVLNCTGKEKPCGECESCKEALSNSHPDIIEIDAASNNGVDEVRSLIERVEYAPMMSKYKVYIIDEVHMMTTGAFNALLKTIEEPPAHVIFILATTEPHKVISTILSRCQRFDFSKVSVPDITFRLRQVCDAEGIHADEDALELIAQLSDGGMRDSLSILDQCVAFSADHVNIDVVRQIYGVVTQEDIGKIFQKLNPEEVDSAAEALSDIHNQGLDLKRFTADFIHLLKNSMILDFKPATRQIPESEKKILENYFLSAPSEKRMGLIRDLMEIYNKLAFASNVLDYIETVLLKHSYVKEEKSSSQSYEIAKQTPPRAEKPVFKSPPQPIFPQQSPKNKDSSPLSDQFWKSDVSRETLETHSERPQNVVLEPEFLLSLLVGADKESKAKDQESFKTLSIYMSNLDYAKYAASLRNFSLLAAGPDFVLVTVRQKRQADEINELQKDGGYEAFTRKILGQPKQVFAISTEEGKHLIGEFKKRAAAKTLPEPAKLDLKKEVRVDEDQQQIELLKTYFPDLKVIDD